MSAVDYTYFMQGPITIAQVTETSVQNQVKYFIDVYAPEYLKLLLGEALYNSYMAGIAADPPDAKWSNLDAQLFKAIGTSKVSPVANYVFWFFAQNDVTNNTGSGEKVLLADKTRPAGNNFKVKRAWNDMARMSKEIQSWITERPADYPEYLKPEPDFSTPEKRKLYEERTNILKTTILHF